MASKRKKPRAAKSNTKRRKLIQHKDRPPRHKAPPTFASLVPPVNFV